MRNIRSEAIWSPYQYQAVGRDVVRLIPTSHKKILLIRYISYTSTCNKPRKHILKIVINSSTPVPAIQKEEHLAHKTLRYRRRENFQLYPVTKHYIHSKVALKST